MKRSTIMLLTAVAVCGALSWMFVPMTAAQEFTNRRDVMQDETLRTDFVMQGEYIGEWKNSDGKDQRTGVQLIADGDSKFRLVVYPNGLPGDGWDRSMIRILGTAKYEDGKLVINCDSVKMADGKTEKIGEDVAAVKNIVCTVEMSVPTGPPSAENSGQGRPAGRGYFGPSVKLVSPAMLGNPAITFQKVNRRSPTLGKTAPDGAVVIFDGTDTSRFENGATINESPRGIPGSNTLWSEATTKLLDKKPYTLHVEFLLSYMPQAQGQKRSNSGVYIDECYECQVLDSFGLEGENNECGGFYQVAKPIVNACFPPLEWQTYDIDVTPATYDAEGKKLTKTMVSVKHNGILIHDNIEFEKETPGRKKESPEARGFYLQGHGNKVQYRNIWVQYK